MSVHEYATKKGPRFYFTFDPPRGRGDKRDPIKKGGFIDRPTAELAEEKARERFSRLFKAQQQGRSAARGTVAAELSEWLDLRMESIELTTYATQKYRLQAYITPHVGDLTIHRASESKTLLAFYHTLVTRGGVKGGGLGKSLAAACYRQLVGGLESVGLDMSEAPKVRGLNRRYRTPGRRPSTGHHGTWSADQVRQFLGEMRGHRLYAAWVLLFVTGLRRGELCGLRWKDVDLEARCIHIENQRAQVIWAETPVIDKEPKYQSYRDIPLDDWVCDVLREHKKRMDSEVQRRIKYAARRRDNPTHSPLMGEYVLVNWRAGAPLNPSSLGEQFKVCVAKTDLPYIALHDGRHSVATIGHDAGVPFKSMQALLGHQHPATLLGIYTHHTEKPLREGVEALGGVLSPESVEVI